MNKPAPFTPDEQAELIDGARTATEPMAGFWDQLAQHFEDQRGLVTPRKLDGQNPNTDY